MGKFVRQSLRTFHCFSEFWIKTVNIMRPRLAPMVNTEYILFFSSVKSDGVQSRLHWSNPKAQSTKPKSPRPGPPDCRSFKLLVEFVADHLLVSACQCLQEDINAFLYYTQVLKVVGIFAED